MDLLKIRRRELLRQRFFSFVNDYAENEQSIFEDFQVHGRCETLPDPSRTMQQHVVYKTFGGLADARQPKMNHFFT